MSFKYEIEIPEYFPEIEDLRKQYYINFQIAMKEIDECLNKIREKTKEFQDLDKYFSDCKKEKLCCTCLNDFNDCESIYEITQDIPGDLAKIWIGLCPKCCHENWKTEVYPRCLLRKRNHNNGEF